MHRRNFLKTGSLAGLTISTLVAASCNQPSAENKADETAAVDNSKDDIFELSEITIADLQQKMQSKQFTSRLITELYLKRIDQIDKKGIMLNSVIELNKDALNMADAMDREREKGKVRGPLHGIPVLIKDNINTGDNMHTTAGSLALADNFAKQDAFIVHKLREAGAVILGKTNLSEWANFRSTHSTSAWSSRGGQTKCPYILDRNPSGSSAGTGTAVAANLCVIGIGTETNGSIVSPASVNGLVGIKPTVGLWSRSGIIPISKTQDTAGPMARTVKDAAILLGALTGIDTLDLATLGSKGRIEADYTKFLDVNGLQGKRLGIEKTAFDDKPDVAALLQDAIKTLKSKGAEVVEIELNKELKTINSNEFTVLLYEFKDGLNQYFNNANSKIKTLADVIAFNKQNETKAMPFFKQEILEQAQAKGDLNSKEYLDAVKQTNMGTRKVIDGMLTKYKLDAIIGTTNGPAVCIDLVNGDYDNGFSFSGPAAMAGYPHITVPMGLAHGLPVGLSFFSTAYKEGDIIKLGYAYEQASKRRVAPLFKPDLFA
ncbi:amidase [Mucilaginibacter rubeus]|uniref:Amidase n=1 Tax=Mucilaginibacter rubeus TaxID=2027860 RepID=A0AAE6JAX8_9SPHI|nr:MULTISPECIES: amidase [Mucilaginibacter]QEM02334.1 amidase [Mucilaginibacter rubeus]QEM14960.1 amidase [Mucilaginibacter gossypii]QTE42325.1 amidase [Mucilaginibacter rubeus]QTE48926.1 amidase [Mucilaginibacter rubeus]QTE54024.1 amidase [Mucilaginibacter rubeus]